jgi:predicted DNA-binding ribbon-helix-helix protein
MNTHEGRSLAEAGKTQLRVLQRRGTKMAVRLERIFWSQLDDLAREAKSSTSKLVFDILASNAGALNKTGLLRCFCLERARSKSSISRLQAESFDMLGIIAACPTPVAVITPQRKIAAFNPAFSNLITLMRGSQNKDKNKDNGMAIQLSFSESVPKIQQSLLDQPTRISVFQIGIQVGTGVTQYHYCRFALADRSKAGESLIILFFEERKQSA